MSKTPEKPVPNQPDPLAEMIVELHERVKRLEMEREVAKQLIHTLADAGGWELEIGEQGLKWVRKSNLVTL